MTWGSSPVPAPARPCPCPEAHGPCGRSYRSSSSAPGGGCWGARPVGREGRPVSWPGARDLPVGRPTLNPPLSGAGVLGPVLRAGLSPAVQGGRQAGVSPGAGRMGCLGGSSLTWNRAWGAGIAGAPTRGRGKKAAWCGAFSSTRLRNQVSSEPSTEGREAARARSLEQWPRSCRRGQEGAGPLGGRPCQTGLVSCQQFPQGISGPAKGKGRVSALRLGFHSSDLEPQRPGGSARCLREPGLGARSRVSGGRADGPRRGRFASLVAHGSEDTFITSALLIKQNEYAEYLQIGSAGSL